MPLETVSAKDGVDAIVQVHAMYPHRSNESLTAILVKKIETDSAPESE